MIINKRVIFLVFLLVVLSVYSIKISSDFLLMKLIFNNAEAVASDAQEITKPVVRKFPFKIGEKLYYGIYSTGFKIGNATITYLGEKEINGKLVSYITLEARAPGFYDFEKIYGNIEDSTPVRIEREIRLFGKDIKIIEEYNQKKKEVRITRIAKKTEIKIIKSNEKINNIILLLYQFRYKKDYRIGDKLQFNLPTKELVILIDRETKIKVPEGRYLSIFVQSIPKRFKVWFRKNGDRIPLRIQGAIGFGNTYLALLKVDQP